MATQRVDLYAKVMATFNVTYEIWDAESCEAGETDERGFEWQGATLRDAVKTVLATRTNLCGGIESIEPSDSRIEHARSITVHNGMEFETGARESRSIHFPESLSGATRRRIARLIGVRGV